jgi:hypothetical protein
LSEALLARPISSLVMNTSNNSNASSVAVTSSHRTVASNVANRRRYGCRASFGAFAAIPYRASSITRRVGTAATSTRRIPRPAIDATRVSAPTMPRPEVERSPRRPRSSCERRCPSGTCSTDSNACAWSAVTAPASWSNSRVSAAWRTSATSSTSGVTPGSSTLRSRSQPTAVTNNAFGPSPVVHARRSSHSTSCCCAEANETKPPTCAISH